MDKERLLERTKINAFLYKEAAFLGSIMSKLDFKWDDKIPTACASATILRWNPNWFENLTEESRIAVLLHELWHIARLHGLRGENKDHEIWNIACDIRINNDLIADGYTFTDAGGMFDLKLDKDKRMTEEEIYDYLIQNQIKMPLSAFGNDIDYIKPGSEEEHEIVQIVQSSSEFSKTYGLGTNSEIEEIIMQHLKPRVPWRRLLRQYFLDISKDDWSWARPNRRYEDIYLPSMIDSGKLIALNYYIDTSGSISKEMLMRFNAELRAIHQDIRPNLLRVISFDTKIQEVTEISLDMPFKFFKFKGRGGTAIEPVFEHIEETKPAAAIVFSDMVFYMPDKHPKTPIIWIIVNNPKIVPPFGKYIHISKEDLTDGSKR